MYFLSAIYFYWTDNLGIRLLGLLAGVGAGTNRVHGHRYSGSNPAQRHRHFGSGLAQRNRRSGPTADPARAPTGRHQGGIRGHRVRGTDQFGPTQ